MTEKDYISRDAAIRAHCDGCVDDGYCGKLDGRYACDDVPQIMAIPSADVRPVVYGEWVPSINPDLPGYLMCSACKEAFYNPSAQPHQRHLSYCFHCGADMRSKHVDQDDN